VLWTGTPPAPPRPVRDYRPLAAIQGPWQTGAGIRRTLEDWRLWPKFGAYSGTMRYSRTIQLEDPDGVAVDLGQVAEIAELHVNGRAAGVRIAPPYRFDLSSLAQAGENRIDIDVTNTAQARWEDPFSHGDAVSGLLGPVWLLRAATR
jgi:hypothetical protein